MGALGDDLHGDRRDRVAPDGGDRRSRGSPQALPRAPHVPVRGRDRADGHRGAGRRPVGPRAGCDRDGRVRSRHRLLQRVPPRPRRRDVAGPAIRVRVRHGLRGLGARPGRRPAVRAARLLRRRLPHGRGAVRALLPARHAVPASRPPGRPHDGTGDPGRLQGHAREPAEDRPNPRAPRVPPRLPVLRGRHQHGRLLLGGVRGPHPRLHDRRGDRALLRRPDLGPRGRLALGQADRHVGPEERRNDDLRSMVPGRPCSVLRHDQGPVLRGGGLCRNRARRDPGRRPHLHGELDPQGPGGRRSSASTRSAARPPR